VRCAAAQQHVGEAASRSADVHRATASGIEAEMVERGGKLQSATARVFGRFTH